jgi:hypothetical protein
VKCLSKARTITRPIRCRNAPGISGSPGGATTKANRVLTPGQVASNAKRVRCAFSGSVV